MKICDVCKVKNGDPLSDESVHTVMIGTDIVIVKVGDSAREIPVENELCGKCIRRVNGSIANHLEAEFDLKIRWTS